MSPEKDEVPTKLSEHPLRKRRCLVCTLPAPHDEDRDINGYTAHRYDPGDRRAA